MRAPETSALEPPDRLLLGPGPSEVHPRVLRAMSTPLVGHLDPAFLAVMNEVQDLLRYTFRTENRWTIPVSGTGSAAMEAAFANLIEPGDTVLVPSNGYFGARMESIGAAGRSTPTRCGRRWSSIGRRCSASSTPRRAPVCSSRTYPSSCGWRTKWARW